MKVQHALVSAPKTDLVWVPTKDGVQLAHKVSIAAQMPTGGYVQLLNAHSGEALMNYYSTSLPRVGKNSDRSFGITCKLHLRHIFDRQQAMKDLAAKGLATVSSVNSLTSITTVASGINGSGLVFDPDPRTALNTDSLTDTSAATAFDAAYPLRPCVI